MRRIEQFHRPRIRVLAITPQLSPGGAELWLTTLVKYGRNATYTILTPKKGTLSPNCHIVEIGFDDSQSPERHMEQAVYEHAGQYDLVLYWGMGPMALDSVNVPVIYVMHGSAMEDGPHRQYLERMGETQAHYTVGVSESACTAFKESARAVSTVIHNGCSLERTRPVYGGEVLREQWGISPEKKIMLYNGRFSPGKGPDVCMRALEYLPEEWVSVLHGWGPMEKELKQESKQWPGRVYFPQSRTTGLGDLYDMADAVVIASESEAFPLVLIEAWHAGTRVVCSEFNTLHEIERKYNSGGHMADHIHCPPVPQEVAQALLSKERPGVVERAQTIALRAFSASAMVGRWELFYQRCLAEWHQLGHVGAVDVS